MVLLGASRRECAGGCKPTLVLARAAFQVAVCHPRHHTRTGPGPPMPQQCGIWEPGCNEAVAHLKVADWEWHSLVVAKGPARTPKTQGDPLTDNTRFSVFSKTQDSDGVTSKRRARCIYTRPVPGTLPSQLSTHASKCKVDHKRRAALLTHASQCSI
jgi:hypothetical protein